MNMCDLDIRWALKTHKPTEIESQSNPTQFTTKQIMSGVATPLILVVSY